MEQIQERDRGTFQELVEVRDQAVEHARQAQQLSRRRRDLIDTLLSRGYAQADIARELSVTRQAVQKMVAAV